MRLARAKAKPVSALGLQTLVFVNPSGLWINGRRAPEWPKPPGFVPPPFRRGVRPVVQLLHERLARMAAQTPGAGPQLTAALRELESRLPRGDEARHRAAPLHKSLTGLTVLTLITAKLTLPSRGPHRLHLAIDPSTSANAMSTLMPLLVQASFDGVSLLFEPPDSPPAPRFPVPSLARSFARLGSPPEALTQARLARDDLTAELGLWQKRDCAAVAEQGQALMKSPHGKPCLSQARGLARALSTCACARDVPALLTIIQGALGPHHILNAWHGRLAPLGEPVTARPAERWQNIAPRFLAKGKPLFWLRLDPPPTPPPAP